MAKPKTSQDKKKTSLKKKYLFGYDAHLVVTRDAEHDAVLLDDGTPTPTSSRPSSSASPSTSPATAPPTTA